MLQPYSPNRDCVKTSYFRNLARILHFFGWVDATISGLNRRYMAEMPSLYGRETNAIWQEKGRGKAAKPLQKGQASNAVWQQWQCHRHAPRTE